MKLITSVTIQKNATIDEVHDRDREFYWYIQSTNILTIKVEQQMRLGTVDIQKPLWRVSRYREKNYSPLL